MLERKICCPPGIWWHNGCFLFHLCAIDQIDTVVVCY